MNVLKQLYIRASLTVLFQRPMCKVDSWLAFWNLDFSKAAIITRTDKSDLLWLEDGRGVGGPWAHFIQ